MTDAAKADDPTPPARKRGPRLGDISATRRELERVYRECRTGTLSAETATKLAYMLSLLGKMIEAETIERRIADLEKVMEGARPANTLRAVR